MGKSSAATIQSRRSWYRLHLSTWLILAIATIAAATIVLPGGLGRYPERWAWRWGHDYDYDVVVHGWPLPYLWRRPAGWAGDPAKISPWLPWRLTDSAADFHVLPLLADLALAGTALTALAALLEWRRRRWRRFIQFSLRGLLLFAVLSAMALGWWGREHAADGQIKERLSALGMSTAPQANVMFPLMPRFPLWLRTLVGDEKLSSLGLNEPGGSLEVPWQRQHLREIQYIVDRYPHVVGLYVFNYDGAEDAAGIASVHGLERIVVGYGPDAVPLLRAMAHNADLRELYMPDVYTRVGDEGMSLIATLPNLRSLSIVAAQPSSQHWLADLRRCGKVEHLGLACAELSSDALACLASMNQLRSLDLSESYFPPDADPRPLCRLDRLDELLLSNTGLTDAEALRLREFRGLRSLHIDGNPLTSAGIARLLNPSECRFAPGLEQIYIDKFNDDVVAALRKLPRLHYIAPTWTADYGVTSPTPQQRAILSKLQQALPDRDISANLIQGPIPD